MSKHVYGTTKQTRFFTVYIFFNGKKSNSVCLMSWQEGNSAKMSAGFLQQTIS